MIIKQVIQAQLRFLMLLFLVACSPGDRVSENTNHRHEGAQPVAQLPDTSDMTHDTPQGYEPVTISDERRQRFSITTQGAVRKVLATEIRTVGIVRTDETRESHVHMKWNGWIEEIYVNYVGQTVKKGERLFSVYSAELLTAQQELIIASRRATSAQRSASDSEQRSNDVLLSTARAKLRLWEVTEDTIAEIERTGKVQRSVTILSPQTGTVIAKAALAGMYVDPAMDLYAIADLTEIWINADVYEFQAPSVAVGMRATFEPIGVSASQRLIEAPVAFVSPVVDPQSRTVKIRLEVHNEDGLLRPGAYGVVRIHVPLPESLVVSSDSVIDTGDQQLLFVDAGDGIFEPRIVKLGVRAQGFVQVLEGIHEGERIVTRGQFLLDSESRLQAVTESGIHAEHTGH